MTFLISSNKPLSIRKLSCSQWEVCIFPDSNFCLRTWILSLPVNTVRVFPEVAGFVVKKMPASYIGLNNHSLSVILSSKSDIPWRKQLVQLAAQSHKMLKCTQWSRWIIFTASSRIFLSEICLFFFFFLKFAFFKPRVWLLLNLVPLLWFILKGQEVYPLLPL